MFVPSFSISMPSILAFSLYYTELHAKSVRDTRKPPKQKRPFNSKRHRRARPTIPLIRHFFFTPPPVMLMCVDCWLFSCFVGVAFGCSLTRWSAHVFSDRRSLLSSLVPSMGRSGSLPRFSGLEVRFFDVSSVAFSGPLCRLLCSRLCRLLCRLLRQICSPSLSLALLLSLFSVVFSAVFVLLLYGHLFVTSSFDFVLFVASSVSVGSSVASFCRLYPRSVLVSPLIASVVAVYVYFYRFPSNFVTLQLIWYSVDYSNSLIPHFGSNTHSAPVPDNAAHIYLCAIPGFAYPRRRSLLRFRAIRCVCGGRGREGYNRHNKWQLCFLRIRSFCARNSGSGFLFWLPFRFVCARSWCGCFSVYPTEKAAEGYYFVVVV